MIEITTGLMFLMTSMYGASSISPENSNIQPIIENSNNYVASIVVSSDRAMLEKYLREYFAGTPILVEIARCESEFRQFDKDGKVVRGRVDSADVGVMQINERYHLETATRLGINIHTVEGNMAYAKYLYEKFGSKPWDASKPCWEKTIAMK